MIPEFLPPFSIYFEFEFMNEWTFECWMECWMNVCKSENSSYETYNFSSNISSNMQKKCWMKCWTGFLRPLKLRLINEFNLSIFIFVVLGSITKNSVYNLYWLCNHNLRGFSRLDFVRGCRKKHVSKNH